jgi:hypothetical protein
VLEKRFDGLCTILHNLHALKQAYVVEESHQKLGAAAQREADFDEAPDAYRRTTSAITTQEQDMKVLEEKEEKRRYDEAVMEAARPARRVLDQMGLHAQLKDLLHLEKTNRFTTMVDVKTDFMEKEVMTLWDEAVDHTGLLCVDQGRLMSKIKSDVTGLVADLRLQIREGNERIAGVERANRELEQRVVEEAEKRSKLELEHEEKLYKLEEKYASREDQLLKSKLKTETTSAEVNTTVNAFHSLFRAMHRKINAAKEGNSLSVFQAWRELKAWQTRIKLKYQIKQVSTLKQELVVQQEKSDFEKEQLNGKIGTCQEDISGLRAKLRSRETLLHSMAVDLEKLQKELMQLQTRTKLTDGALIQENEYRYFPRPREDPVVGMMRFELPESSRTNMIKDAKFSLSASHKREMPIDMRKLAYMLFVTPNEEEFQAMEQKKISKSVTELLAQQDENAAIASGKGMSSARKETLDAKYIRAKAEREMKKENAVRAKEEEEERAEKEFRAKFGWTMTDGSLDGKLPPLLWVVNCIRSLYSDRLMYELLHNVEGNHRDMVGFPEFVFSWFQAQAQEEKVHQQAFYIQPTPCKAPALYDDDQLEDLSVDQLAAVRREQFLRGLFAYNNPVHCEWFYMIGTFSRFLQEDYSTSTLSFCLGFIMTALGTYRLRPILHDKSFEHVSLKKTRTTLEALILTAHAGNQERNFKQVYQTAAQEIGGEVDDFMMRAKARHKKRVDSLRIIVSKSGKSSLTQSEREMMSDQCASNGLDVWLLVRMLGQWMSETEDTRQARLGSMYTCALDDVMLMRNQYLIAGALAKADKAAYGNDERDEPAEDEDDGGKKSKDVEEAFFMEYMGERKKKLKMAAKLELNALPGAGSVDVAKFGMIVRHYLNFSVPQESDANDMDPSSAYEPWMRPGYVEKKVRHKKEKAEQQDSVKAEDHKNHHYHIKNRQLLISDLKIAQLYRQTHQFGGGRMTKHGFLCAVARLGANRHYQMVPLDSMYKVKDMIAQEREKKSSPVAMRNFRPVNSMSEKVRQFSKKKLARKEGELLRKLQSLMGREYELAKEELGTLKHFPVSSLRMANFKYRFLHAVKFAPNTSGMFYWRALMAHLFVVKSVVSSYDVTSFLYIPQAATENNPHLLSEQMSARLQSRMPVGVSGATLSSDDEEDDQGDMKDEDAKQMAKQLRASNIVITDKGLKIMPNRMPELRVKMVSREMRSAVGLLLNGREHPRYVAEELKAREKNAVLIQTAWRAFLQRRTHQPRRVLIPKPFWPHLDADEARSFLARQWPIAFILDLISQIYAGYMRELLKPAHVPHKDAPHQHRFADYITAFLFRCNGQRDVGLRMLIDMLACVHAYGPINHRVRVFGQLLGVEPIQFKFKDRPTTAEAENNATSQYKSPYQAQYGFDKDLAEMFTHVLYRYFIFKSNTQEVRSERALDQGKEISSSYDARVAHPEPMPLPSQLFPNNVRVHGGKNVATGVTTITDAEAQGFTEELFATASMRPGDDFKTQYKEIVNDALMGQRQGFVDFDLLLESLTYAMLAEKRQRTVVIQDHVIDVVLSKKLSLSRMKKHPAFSVARHKKTAEPQKPTGTRSVRRFVSYKKFVDVVAQIDGKFPELWVPGLYVDVLNIARKTLTPGQTRGVADVLKKVLLRNKVGNPMVRADFYGNYLVKGGQAKDGSDANAHFDWEVLNNVFHHRKPLLAKQHQTLHKHADGKQYELVSSARKKFMTSLSDRMPPRKKWGSIEKMWYQYHQILTSTSEQLRKTGIVDDEYPDDKKKPGSRGTNRSRGKSSR